MDDDQVDKQKQEENILVSFNGRKRSFCEVPIFIFGRLANKFNDFEDFDDIEHFPDFDQLYPMMDSMIPIENEV